jgi:hypothetical protein
MSNALATSQHIKPLTLTLLMTRLITDHPHHTFTPNDFAFTANLFY